MIYLIFGFLLMLLWYMADKNLKGKFLPYLKWPALLFALYFIAFECYYQIELSRIIRIDETNDNGLYYSYYNNITNLTQEYRLYATQGIDRGEVFSYFKAENELNHMFGSLLGEILLLCIFGLLIQYMYIIYENYINGKEDNDA